MASFQLKVRQPGGEVLTESFSEYWPESRNGIPLAEVGRHCNSPCVITRLCQQHSAMLQPKSLFDNFSSRCNALDCKVCKRFNNTIYFAMPSTYEESGYAAMARLPPDLGVTDHDWHTDVVILGSKFSSVDIYVPKYRLCVMIDGEQHFSSKKQLAVDVRFNDAAFESGYRVLRLHYEDSGIFRQIIFKTVLACKKGARRCEVEYSDSFD